MPISRILVVDDSPTERLLLTRSLEGGGYQVITAETCEDAIAKCRTLLPDLVLMDVVMPGGMNGFQATRTLSRDDRTRHIPVIICSTKSEATDRVWGLRQGARDYLTKPVDAGELLAKIRAYD